MQYTRKPIPGRLSQFAAAAALAASGQRYDDGDIADVIAYKTSLAFDRRQVALEQALNSIVALGICAAEIAHRPLRSSGFWRRLCFHYFRASDALWTSL